MKRGLKYFIIGFIIGAILGFIPPFHLLSLPIIIPLSKIFSDNNFISIFMVFMAVTNGIIYGIISLVISLFKKGKEIDKDKKKVREGSKTGFFISLVGGLVFLIPMISVIFTWVYGGSGKIGLEIFIIVLYGIAIVISAILMKKDKTLRTGAIISILLGILPFLPFIFLLIGILPKYFGYVLIFFIGELSEGGSKLAIILFSSFILTIIGGIFGFIRSMKNNSSSKRQQRI